MKAFTLIPEAAFMGFNDAGHAKVCAWCAKEHKDADTKRAFETVTHGICLKHRDELIADALHLRRVDLIPALP